VRAVAGLELVRAGRHDADKGAGRHDAGRAPGAGVSQQQPEVRELRVLVMAYADYYYHDWDDAAVPIGDDGQAGSVVRAGGSAELRVHL
jgi:hypothetical protein